MGRGSIQQRGDTSWRVSVGIGRDETGKYCKAERTVRGNRKDAELELAKLILEVENNQYKEPTKMTLDAYLDYWLENYTINLKEKTQRWYSQIINNHIKPKLGHIRLDKISTIDIQRYLNIMRKNSNLSDTSIHGQYMTIKTALERAVKWNLISNNPATGALPPKRIKHQSGRSLTPEEAERFLKVANDKDTYCLYLLAISLGMRQGELLGLQWSDIDLDNGIIHIKHTLFKGGKAFKLTPVKTHRSNRPVVLPEVALSALKRHKLKSSSVSFVFTSANGYPLLARNLLRQFKGILKQAKLPDMRFHDLRHSTATLLLSHGVSIKMISDLLGHSSTSFTMDVYSHVLMQMQTEASMAMNNILTKNKKASSV